MYLFTKSTLLAFGLLLILTVLVACGGSSNSTSDDTPVDDAFDDAINFDTLDENYAFVIYRGDDDAGEVVKIIDGIGAMTNWIDRDRIAFLNAHPSREPLGTATFSVLQQGSDWLVRGLLISTSDKQSGTGDQLNAVAYKLRTTTTPGGEKPKLNPYGCGIIPNFGCGPDDNLPDAPIIVTDDQLVAGFEALIESIPTKVGDVAEPFFVRGSLVAR